MSDAVPTNTPRTIEVHHKPYTTIHIRDVLRIRLEDMIRLAKAIEPQLPLRWVGGLIILPALLYEETDADTDETAAMFKTLLYTPMATYTPRVSTADTDSIAVLDFSDSDLFIALADFLNNRASNPRAAHLP